MSRSKENHFDSIIRRSIEAEMDNIEVPEMDDVWSKIDLEINKSKKNKIISSRRKIAATVGVFIIMGLTLLNTDIGYGYFERVISFFTNATGSSTTLDIESRSNTPRNPEMELAPIEHILLSIDDVRKNSSFSFKTPSILPQGYSFKEATLIEFNGQTISVEIKYSTGDELINISIKPLMGDYVSSMNINTDHVQLIELEENNKTYNVIEFDHGETIIIWDDSEVIYTAEGKNRADLLELILSLK